MTRKLIGKQSRKILPEHQLINDTVNTIVTSKKTRAKDYLTKIKQDSNMFGHNQNPNFDRDFIEVVNLSSKSLLHADYNYLDCLVNFAFPLFKNQP